MTAPTGIRNYSNTAIGTTLTASAGATDTTLSLAAVTGDPTVPFTASLSRGTANEEVVLVTAIIGTTATVTRGFDGTSAKAQSAGASFQEVVVGLDFREANNHVNTVGAVHGVTSQLVGISDTQTLTNKTLTAPAISNPTVTGTATLAATTATSLAVTGATSLTTLSVSGVSALAGLTATTGSFTSTLAVSGLLTASGGVTVPAGQALTSSGTATLASGQVTATPAAAADIVRKDYADALGVSTASPSTIARRDSSGNIAANEVMVAGQTTAASAARRDYVDSALNGGSSGVMAGTAPSTTSKLLIKTFYGTLTTNANGDVSLTFPGGAFPNGVLAVHAIVALATPAVAPIFWITEGATLSAVSMRAYSASAGSAVATLAVPTSVTAIGW